MSDLCQVCRTAPSKYKCGLCRVTRYCSLVCFNKHKGADGDCPKRPGLAAAIPAPTAPAAAAVASGSGDASAAAAPPSSAATAPVTSALLLAGTTTAAAVAPASPAKLIVAGASNSPAALTAAPASSASTTATASTASSSASTAASASASASAPAAAGPPASRLSDEQVAKILQSDAIRRALSSRELRGIITDVDTAPNRELALQQQLMHNSDLAQFVNELLLTIHGAEYYAASYGGGASSGSGELLQMPAPLGPNATPAAAATALLTSLAVAHQHNAKLG